MSFTKKCSAQFFVSVTEWDISIVAWSQGYSYSYTQHPQGVETDACCIILTCIHVSIVRAELSKIYMIRNIFEALPKFDVTLTMIVIVCKSACVCGEYYCSIVRILQCAVQWQAGPAGWSHSVAQVESLSSQTLHVDTDEQHIET